MESFLGSNMFKFELHTRGDMLEGVVLPIEGFFAVFGDVDKKPVIILIAMGVECDLLF